MRGLHTVGLFILGLALAACNQEPVRFDATSDDALKESTRAVGLSMPEAQRPALQAALAQIALHSFASAGGFSLAKLAATGHADERSPDIAAQIAPIINGRTGLEVIGIAAELQRKRVERQLVAIDSEISSLTTELADGKARALADRAVLDRITVEGARYFWSKQAYSKQAVIAFKITNGSDRAISKIYMNGVLETPGRSVPWVQDGFNYAIKGGLEPGESQSLNLLPNMFGAWSGAELRDRKDLVLTLSLRGIVDANGAEVGGKDGDAAGRTAKRLEVLARQRTKLIAQLTPSGDGGQTN